MLPEPEEQLENGDLFEGDTGQHLGNIMPESDGIPAQLQVYFNKYFYVYKLDYRVHENDSELEQKTIDIPKFL